MSENKEGQPYKQNLNTEMKTMYVLHKGFSGDTCLINADTFDPDVHTRCNELGQEINERGHIIRETDKAATAGNKFENSGANSGDAGTSKEDGAGKEKKEAKK